MRHLIVATVLALILTVAMSLAASASYTDAFGHTYTDAQVAQFCAALRPGSASWVRYDCGNLP